MSANPLDAFRQPANENNDLTATIRTQASMAGVPFDVGYRLVKQESSFNPHAKNPSGASGLTQLLPDTAKEMGVGDIWNPAENLAGGFKYLSQQYKKYGNWRDALAAYNWGPGNVDSWLKQGGNVAHLPSETRNYIAKIAPASLQPQHQAVSPIAQRSNLEMMSRRVPGGANPLDAMRHPAPSATKNPLDAMATPPSDFAQRAQGSTNPMDTPDGGTSYSQPGPQPMSPVAQTALSELAGHQDFMYILHNAQVRDAAQGRDKSILELGKDPSSNVARAMAMYKKDPGAAMDEYGMGAVAQYRAVAQAAPSSMEGKFAKFMLDHPKANAALTFFAEGVNPMAMAEGEGAGKLLGLAAKVPGAAKVAQGAARAVGMGSPLAEIAQRGGTEGSQWAKSLIASVAAPHKFLHVASTDDLTRTIFGGLSPEAQEEVVALSQGQKPDVRFMAQYNDLKQRAMKLRGDIKQVTGEQERVGRLDRDKGQVYSPDTYFPMSRSYDFGPQANLEEELRGSGPTGGGTTANRPKQFANVRASRASGLLDKDFLPANNYATWREQRLQRVAFDDAMARAPQSLRRDIAPADYATGSGQVLEQPWQRNAAQTPQQALDQTVTENQARYPVGHPARLDVQDTPQYVRATNVLNNTPSSVIKRSMMAPELLTFLQGNKGLQKYIASGGSMLPGQAKTWGGKFIELARNAIVSNFAYHPAVNIAGNDAAARGMHMLGGNQWEAGGYAANAARAVAHQAGVDPKAFLGGAKNYANWLDRALKAGGIAEFARPGQSALGAERARVLTVPAKKWSERLDKAFTQAGDFNRDRTFGEKGEEAFAVSLFKDAVQRGKMNDAQAGQMVREALGDYYNYDPNSPWSALSMFMPWRKGNWKFWTSALVRRPQYATGTAHAIRNLNEQNHPEDMDPNFAAPDFAIQGALPGNRPLTLPFVGRDVAQIADLGGSAAKALASRAGIHALGDAGPGDLLDPAIRLGLGSGNPLVRAGLDAYQTNQSRYSPEVQGPETNFSLIFDQKALPGTQWGQVARYFAGKVPVPLIGFAVQDAARRGLSPQDTSATLLSAIGAGYAGQPKLSQSDRKQKALATRQFKQAYDRYTYDDHDPAALKQAWDTYQAALRDLGVIH